MSWDFNGSTDYMESALPTTYTTPITLACWFNSDTTNVTKTLISLANGSTTEDTSVSLTLGLSSSAAITAITSTATGQNIGTRAAYSLQTWHHAAAVFSSDSNRVAYLDGTAGTPNTTSRTASNLDNLILGQGSGGTYNPTAAYNGRLAEVAVWNVGLSADEILSLAKGTKAIYVRPQSLLYYVPLISDINEIISSLTMTNAATAASVHSRRYG